jgi:uncharacterized membrane protein
VVIELRARPGETVFEGDTVVTIHGRPEGKLADEVWKALTVGPERTFDQDPLFALRVLADIALRALSSAINDPTTAAQALDGIEQLLRRLAWRDLDISRVTDSNGALRVILPAPDWDLYVSVALDEIIFCSRSAPQVIHRVHDLLDRTIEMVPPQRRPALENRLRQLDQADRGALPVRG